MGPLAAGLAQAQTRSEAGAGVEAIIPPGPLDSQCNTWTVVSGEVWGSGWRTGGLSDKQLVLRVQVTLGLSWVAKMVTADASVVSRVPEQPVEGHGEGEGVRG